MNLSVKEFKDLTTAELYEILRLRSEVFIVEQQGCYQDLDGIDYRSLHIYEKNEVGAVDGCIRIFPKEDESGTVQLGRLVVRHRRQGLGRRLMEAAEDLARCRYSAAELFLEGRRDARAFYEAMGYTAALPPCYDTEAEALYFEFRKSLI